MLFISALQNNKGKVSRYTTASYSNHQRCGIGYKSNNNKKDQGSKNKGTRFDSSFLLHKLKLFSLVQFAKFQESGDLFDYLLHSYQLIKLCRSKQAPKDQLKLEDFLNSVSQVFYNKQKQMIGSLGQFIPLQTDSILAQDIRSDRPSQYLSPLRQIKQRGKSTFDKYVPQDKTDLLLRYEKNNIYHINRKKYTSIQKQAKSKDKIKRPLYQHHSFFVKPEIAKDYISKQQLKRKHNLLRAIMRMKQNQQQPKGESDYQQSFQRLYSGFRLIHPEPTLERKEEVVHEEQIVVNPKAMPTIHSRSKSNIPNRKRLQFEHCLSWAKKHKKNGDYFAEQLGKFQKNHSAQNPILNRSLIDQIVKKVDLSWLD